MLLISQCRSPCPRVKIGWYTDESLSRSTSCRNVMSASVTTNAQSRSLRHPSPPFTLVIMRGTTVAVRRANNLNESTTAVVVVYNSCIRVTRLSCVFACSTLKNPVELSLQPTLDIATSRWSFRARDPFSSFCTFSYFFFLVLFFFSISLVLDARIKSDLIAWGEISMLCFVNGRGIKSFDAASRKNRISIFWYLAQKQL